MAQKPRRFVGDAKHPRHLQSAHALLTGTEQMDGLKPLGQWDVRPLEDRACPHRTLLAATVALVEASPLTVQLRDLVELAERALCAIRPAERLKMGYCVLFNHNHNYKLSKLKIKENIPANPVLDKLPANPV